MQKSAGSAQNSHAPLVAGGTREHWFFRAQPVDRRWEFAVA